MASMETIRFAPMTGLNGETVAVPFVVISEGKMASCIEADINLASEHTSWVHLATKGGNRSKGSNTDTKGTPPERRFQPDKTRGFPSHNPDASVRPSPEPLTWDVPSDSSKGVLFFDAVLLGTGGYLLYRSIRLLPSLFPPLWATVPVNLVVP